jgi:transposase
MELGSSMCMRQHTHTVVPIIEPVRCGDRAGQEARRFAAAELFQAGHSCSAVARALGVSCQSASRWKRKYDQGGQPALQAALTTKPRRLNQDQLVLVQQALLRGALAHGYPTDLWTLARVSQVIESVTGVKYHPHYASVILTRLAWTRQKPARRARERHEEAITTWRYETWPRVKRGQ